MSVTACSRRLTGVAQGGRGRPQPQGHVQVFMNMFKFGMDPQQALDVPRICLAAGTPDGQVLLEQGLEERMEELKARGHRAISIVRGIPGRLYAKSTRSTGLPVRS